MNLCLVQGRKLKMYHKKIGDGLLFLSEIEEYWKGTM